MYGVAMVTRNGKKRLELKCVSSKGNVDFEVIT